MTTLELVLWGIGIVIAIVLAFYGVKKVRSSNSDTKDRANRRRFNLGRDEDQMIGAEKGSARGDGSRPSKPRRCDINQGVPPSQMLEWFDFSQNRLRQLTAAAKADIERRLEDFS